LIYGFFLLGLRFVVVWAYYIVIRASIQSKIRKPQKIIEIKRSTKSPEARNFLTLLEAYVIRHLSDIPLMLRRQYIA
jgi:predicted ATPase